MRTAERVRARCRFISASNILAGVAVGALALLVFMAVLEVPHDAEGWSVLAIMFVLAGAMPVYWLVARGRGRIELDASGARWRTAFGRWHSTRWDETESCDARLPASKEFWTFAIYTRQGAFSWTQAFENAADLAPFAARFCSLIPADPDDWPRHFDYRNGEIIVAALGVPFLGAGLIWELKWALAGNLSRQLALYVPLYGWPLTLAGFGFFGFLLVGVPLLLLVVLGAMARGYWLHRGEVFVADARGLRWNKPGEPEFFAGWDDLQTLHTEARGWPIALPFYRLQTARGDVSWNNSLNGNAFFIRTLAERAPQLKHSTSPRLCEDLSRAPNGEETRFDFKKRDLRALLWLGAVASVLGVLNAIFGPFQLNPDNPPMPPWVGWLLALATLAMTSYGWWLFWRGAIVLDQRGIRWELPLRRRFVAWDEIDELRIEKELFLICGGRKVPLVGAPLRPAHVERLWEQVEARAVNAPRGWQRDEAR